MDELSWIFSYGFFERRLFDLPNFLICLVAVLVGGRLLKVPAIIQLVLGVHCFLPFVLNDVLFSYEYMPDQYKYWMRFNQIRSGDLSYIDALAGGNVQQAAIFFSFLPFPAAVTPSSLGFLNSFLYVALFYWLYSKRVFTPFSMWFFLLYPSMALYSALALRETLILVAMVGAVQFAREGRWVSMALMFIPLYLIKFQNFYILAPILIIYLLFGIRRTGISVGKGVVTAVVGLCGLLGSAPIALPIINKFRVAMFVEDGGSKEDIELISSSFDFVMQGLTSALYFLGKPFPWEAASAMQFVQSLENLIILLLIASVTKLAWRYDPRKLIFWLLFMLFSMSVYGLVVANFGTAARYRYPFIVIYIVFVCAECQVQKVLPSIKRYKPKPVYISHG